MIKNSITRKLSKPSLLRPSSAVRRTTAKPFAVRSKYDPRIGSGYIFGMKPDNIRHPCPICDQVNFTIKYIPLGKITICKCGYETIGTFKAVRENNEITT